MGPLNQAQTAGPPTVAGLALLLAALSLACARPSSPGSQPANPDRTETHLPAESTPTSPPPSVSTSPPASPPTSASANLCGQPRTPPPRALCLSLLGDVPAQGEACDATFHPHVARYVDCPPGDLICNLRMGLWGQVPVYTTPRLTEITSCLAECDAGNGASCARVARAMASIASRSAAEREACETHFRELACRAGLPSTCREPGCGEDEPRQARDHLTHLCQPGEASWACFYLVHSRQMLWGGGKTEGREGYRRLCAARCPPPPGRCYRRMACEALQTAPKP
jgi:hypothetical protein